MKRKNRLAIIGIILAVAFVVPAVTGLDVPSVATAEAAVNTDLNRNSIVLLKGGTYELKVVGPYSSVKWSSNKKSVATVSSSGVVTAKAKGNATIKAKVGKNTYYCDVTVTTKTKYSQTETTYFNEGTRRWVFHVLGDNPLSEKLTIKKIKIIDKYNNELIANNDYSYNQLGMSSDIIAANEQIQNHSSYPDEAQFNKREFRFICETPSGTEVILSYHFDLKKSSKISSSTKVVTTTKTVDYNKSADTWAFVMKLKNPWSRKIKVKDIRCFDYKYGKVIDNANIPTLWIGWDYKTLSSKGTAKWTDHHPYTTEFTGREYRITCVDSKGKKIVFRFIFKMTVDGKSVDTIDEDDPSVYIHNDSVELNKNSNAWNFEIKLENPLSQNITVKEASVVKKLDGSVVDSSDINLEKCGSANLTISANNPYVWKDNHPYTTEFNTMEYRFKCMADDGSEITLVYVYKLTGEKKTYANDNGKDLDRLKYNADFKVKIGNGVYWVPARALGDSSYTNAQIEDLVGNTPEQKQSKIDTLYEALQLYQIGDFRSANDNVRIYENGIDWEHHKPGYYSVLSNEGCCASSSSWLAYILRGDYDEVGYITMSQPDGNGHVINYIKKGDWYYVIDMTHYIATNPMFSYETGKTSDYYNTDFLLGNIHAVKDLKDYANYFVSGASEPPALMFQVKSEEPLALEGVRTDSKITITYGEDDRGKIATIYDNKNDNVELGFAKSPKRLPDWKAICQ